LVLLHRATLAIIIVSAALLVVPAASDNGAFACSCAGPRPASEVYQESDAVFVGKAVDIKSKDHFNIVQFDVDMAWKGVPEGTVLVKTAESSATCGYDFEQGQNYLVYAHNSSNYLSTGTCGRTQPFEGAFQDLAYLGPGYIPAPDQPIVEREPGGSWLSVLLVGIAAIGTVAFVVLRKRVS
jgi:hypothetical protein